MAQSKSATESAVKFVGEAILPGGANLLHPDPDPDGNSGSFKTGIIHLGLGVAAGALLGPLGLLLVRANSYSKAVSDQHLTQHVGGLFSS